MDLFNVAFFIINYRYCPEFLFSVHISYNLLYSTEMVPFFSWLVKFPGNWTQEVASAMLLCLSYRKA